MSEFKLSGATRLVTVAMRIKNREKMIHFYRDVVGFSLKREENELAIFGTVEKENELLWLEESPNAAEHTGEIKKLQRLCLVIPTEDEMGDILKRIKDNDYPIEDSLYDDGPMGILLVDPEGNQIEIYYGAECGNQIKDPEPLDHAKLLDKAQGVHQKLSEAVIFDKIHMNTSNLTEETAFLSDVLGLQVKDESGGIHVLNDGNFHVGLLEGHGGTLDLKTDDVLGLDFLKFQVAEADIASLEAHLTAIDQEFFIDKKKSIITVYDPAGIEWWFVKK